MARKTYFFYKIVNGFLHDYLYLYLDFFSEENYPLRSTASSKLRPFSSRTISFKKTFFPYCVKEWNNLNADIKNAISLNIFKKLIITEKKENPLFSVFDELGVKLLTRLRLEFSHLNKHKFRHGLKDTLNPLCTCGAEAKTTEHFLLHCQLYYTHRFPFKRLRNCNCTHNLHSQLYSTEKIKYLCYYTVQKEIILKTQIKI